MAREELKISIILKGGRVLLGAQATGCDPKMTTLTGDLGTALERIPSFVEEANRDWDIAPHNPKSTIAEPEPKPTTRTQQPAATAAKESAPQQRFF